MARKLKVFLSSTAQDLTAFRKAVHARLAASPLFECIRQEDFGARPHPAPSLCKAEVEQCDLFIGLIGMRRGWEPPNDNPGKRSITEMEYGWAKSVAPRFMYVTRDDFPVPGNLREPDDLHQRHIAFRSRIMSELVVSPSGFVSSENLPTPDVLAQQIVDQLTHHVLTGGLIERVQPHPKLNQDALSDAIAAKVIQALEQRGDIKRAEQGGLERGIVFKLAKRLKPDDTLDFDRAVVELENAITIALEAIARGRRDSNEDEFVNAVLKDVAQHTKVGENDRAVKALDDALKELDVREAEQHDVMMKSRLALLQAAVDQDILRRDAVSAAQRIAQSIELQNPNNRTARFAGLRRKHNEFYFQGSNLSLAIAIELARRLVSAASDTDQRATALNDLATALIALGERERDTRRLDEAVTVCRKALEDRTRERVPLEWAMLQNNLGAALHRLGQREPGTARLNEAAAALLEALKERTRERVPLEWATTQNNLAATLKTLGERENDITRFEDAVTAFREVLKERTRERMPREWAMTQHNLAATLRALGERESVGARLEEAIAAYRESQKEFTFERAPFNWAVSTGSEGVALMQLADRQVNAAMARKAVDQIEQALVVLRNSGHVPFTDFYEDQLPRARAVRDRLSEA